MEGLITMQSKIRLPKLAETTDVVVIEDWLVKVGDAVSVGQGLVALETDKAVVELPSPMAGTIVELLVPKDEEATTGDYLCVIEADR